MNVEIAGVMANISDDGSPKAYSIPVAKNIPIILPPKNFTSIAMWGDSLTADVGIPPELSRILNGVTIYNGGVGGQTSTQIKTRMLAGGNLNRYGIIIIWAGRNNISDESTVLSDISEMVGSLVHGRFLVLSVLNAVNEPIGSDNNNHAKSINTILQNRYGSNYVDLRSLYNSGTDNDTPRTEYVSDSIHPKLVASGLMANKIANAIKLNGWVQ